MRISRQPLSVQITIDHKQPENTQYFKYLGSMITKDERHTREIKSWITRAKATFNKKKTFSCSKLDLDLRKKVAKCYIWTTVLYEAENWTNQKVDQKYLENFETWFGEV